MSVAPSPPNADPLHDERWMRRAIQVGLRARGLAEPNPPVGCVLVSPEGERLGEGCTAAFGGAHAEVNAVKDAQSRGHTLQGAVAYVTLEPCAHTGKTPPCADLLIKHELARVVAAAEDPYPQVAGRGFRRLQDAGIIVASGVCAREAEVLNAPFFKRVQSGLPYVISKWAQTLDGKIATATGHSQWISNAESRQRVHELRARVDAIVVGVGTALADDPALTARGVEVHREARRVVIDPNARCTPDLSLFNDAGPPVIWAVGGNINLKQHPVKHAVEDRGGEVFVLHERSADRYALQPLLAHLCQNHRATNVMVEGGAGVHGALLDQGLIDELQIYVAPKLVGDPSAPSAVSFDQAIHRMDQAKALSLVSQEDIGGDQLLTYRVI